MPKMSSPSKIFLKFFFAHENMKKPASKFAKSAQIQPKSQFRFHKNLLLRDFSIMTLNADHACQKMHFQTLFSNKLALWRALCQKKGSEIVLPPMFVLVFAETKFLLAIHTAPMYLLLPLGKWGSKWGDFYWGMGCVLF